MTRAQGQPSSADGIDISGIPKAVLLKHLFNGSRQQGMGLLDERGRAPMTTEQAQAIVDREKVERGGERYELNFDYLLGRVLKVNITTDTLESARLYDRDLGEGACARAVAAARAEAGAS